MSKKTLGYLVAAVFMLFVVGNLLIHDVAKVLSDEEHASAFASSGLVAELNSFRKDTGRLPTQDEGLGVLVTPSNSVAELWNGPYLEMIPTDPWGNEYSYQLVGLEGISYRIVSVGPDGVPSEDDILGKVKGPYLRNDSLE